MPSRRDHRLGLLFVTISAIAWSTAGFFTRLIPLDVFAAVVSYITASQRPQPVASVPTPKTA